MATNQRAVNNGIYDELGMRWYEAQDDPVALLRAEARHRNPWIAARIQDHLGTRPQHVLDVGCGAGFLANDLSQRGHLVVGVDLAQDALAEARGHDASGRVFYQRGDALALPFWNERFDVVCAMDLLEHVEAPARVIAEAARVLKPGGLLFFHTFDRTVWSWLIVVKGVEWFVKHTPKDMHVHRLFIRPAELEAMARDVGLDVVEVVGSRPRVDRSLWKLAWTGVVPEELSFTDTPSTALGYTGLARKTKPRAQRVEG